MKKFIVKCNEFIVLMLLRREVKKEWTTYLIVGIVVTLILTAIITALIVKFCCTNRGDVSPRGRA